MTTILSIGQAAARLSLSPRTVRRLCAAGQLRLILLSPRRRGIAAEDVDRYAMNGWQPDASKDARLSTFGKAESDYFAACQASRPGRTRRISKPSHGHEC